MSKLELFHGSDHVVEKPDYALGKPYNDYGVGFYCTDSFELAGEWACKRGADGFVNKYWLDLEGLKILDLCDGTHNVLEWIALLLKNRSFRLNGELAKEVRAYMIENYAPNVARYDIVRGYRADDSYFQYAETFVENGLSLASLESAMHLGNLGTQTVLVSKRAFKRISFMESMLVFRDEYYPRYIKRDGEARTQYSTSIKGSRTLMNDIFALDILREEMKLDDERIQRIVSK